MVFEVTRLWLYPITYSRKDEYKNRHFVKEEPSKYKRGQQGCPITQRRTIDDKNDSRGNNVKKNGYNRWLGNDERNQKEQHQGMEDGPSIREGQ